MRMTSGQLKYCSLSVHGCMGEWLDEWMDGWMNDTPSGSPQLYPNLLFHPPHHSSNLSSQLLQHLLFTPIIHSSYGEQLRLWCGEQDCGIELWQIKPAKETVAKKCCSCFS